MLAIGKLYIIKGVYCPISEHSKKLHPEITKKFLYQLRPLVGTFCYRNSILFQSDSNEHPWEIYICQGCQITHILTLSLRSVHSNCTTHRSATRTITLKSLARNYGIENSKKGTFRAHF
jgi:hypothetical protein